MGSYFPLGQIVIDWHNRVLRCARVHTAVTFALSFAAMRQIRTVLPLARNIPYLATQVVCAYSTVLCVLRYPPGMVVVCSFTSPRRRWDVLYGDYPPVSGPN